MPRSERALRASHAIGAGRRSGARERVSGSPRGEAPRIRLVNPPRPDVARRPVRRTQSLDPHFASGARRMNEFISADGHPDVRGARALSAEKNQVARLDGSRADLDALAGLLAHRARDANPVLPEHEPDEAAAVEPGRVAAAIAVRRSTEAERRARYRVAVGDTGVPRGFCRCRRRGMARWIGVAATRPGEWLWNRPSRRTSGGGKRQRHGQTEGGSRATRCAGSEHGPNQLSAAAARPFGADLPAPGLPTAGVTGAKPPQTILLRVSHALTASAASVTINHKLWSRRSS